MAFEEILKAVFPLLDGVDLVSCMLVCKQWRNIAQDDYFWKCLCAKKWPSVGRRSHPPTVSYYKLYQNFYKRQYRPPLPPPRLSFDDLEFFIDIWAEDKLVFSDIVPGRVLQNGYTSPPTGSSDLLRFNNAGPDCKMALPVVPGFKVPCSQTLSVSVLVGRKDSNKVASIMSRSVFFYKDHSACRALAFDYLDLSPEHPFISSVRAWFSLLFMEDENVIDVHGLQMDFCDAANSKEEILWLLDILDWK